MSNGAFAKLHNPIVTDGDRLEQSPGRGRQTGEYGNRLIDAIKRHRNETNKVRKCS